MEDVKKEFEWNLWSWKIFEMKNIIKEINDWLDIVEERINEDEDLVIGII